MTPTLPPGASRRELRKAVLRMRLEMHRQELRHEILQITHPLQQVREYGQRLRKGNAPFLLTGGVLALAGLLGRKRGWRRWLRLALIVMPLLRRAQHGTRGRSPLV
ncbi:MULTISPECIES: hypothetical protein [Pseudomonadaceae]|jgi:hypothetical protein|uniref:YqjK-like protein n=3 Tax=Pseudomonadaceae TaxID=135621 RepID=A0A0F3G8C8_ECTOL|nr:MULTISPECIES: hypothetical protein [Pseudomonas]MBJ7548673.1 hypothetical protein [Pseudomonas sp. OA3]AXO61161.1 hypothetical protein DZC76_07450 [Pseudomonas sp. phDV1]ERH49378.1 hypothetical protein O203_16460 [Pseudomonas chengduensis]KJU78097.1 hypothetical protein N619_18525 [Pseudomonas oleovorans]KQO39766.1 hypothetical protein ASF15_21840 [Pseudomonas sp. Leaf83]